MPQPPSAPSRPSLASRLCSLGVRGGLMVGGTLLGFVGALSARSHAANFGALQTQWPPYQPLTSADRVLILSPHLDDESLAAGGLMAQAQRLGVPVRVAFLTNGDGSRSTLIAHNLRHRHPQSMVEFALLRQHEARAACAQFGLDEDDLIFLGYPDGGGLPLWEEFWEAKRPFRSAFTGLIRAPYADARTLRTPYCGDAVWRDLIGVMRDFRPTRVLTTHPADTHPDHATIYNFAALALETLRLEPDTRAWATATRLESFMVHYGIWPVPNGLHPDQVLAPPAPLHATGTQWTNLDLDAADQATKLCAINSYPSQLAVTPRYLRAFARRNEIFGSEPVGCDCIHARTATGLTPRHALNPARDLRALTIERTQDGGLTIQVQLCAPPSERLRYRVLLHAVVPPPQDASPSQQGTPQIRRAYIEWASEDGWLAYWEHNGKREEIPFARDGATLRATLPPSLAQRLLGAADCSLLASASVRQGHKVLTRMPVAVGRFL